MDKILYKKVFTKTVGNKQYSAIFEIQSGNKFSYFSANGEERENGRLESCGMMHDMIKEQFPELAKYLPFHLCDDNGIPVYYYENSLYHLSQGNFSGFESCSLWGVLPCDKTLNYQLNTQKVMDYRLPLLQLAYKQTMAELFEDYDE